MSVIDGTDTLQIGLSDAAIQQAVDAFPSVLRTDPTLFTGFRRPALRTSASPARVE